MKRRNFLKLAASIPFVSVPALVWPTPVPTPVISKPNLHGIAWVVYNKDGTVSDSHNVKKTTKTKTGVYIIEFDKPLGNNYVAIASHPDGMVVIQ